MEEFVTGHAVIVGVGADLPSTVADAVGVARILKDPQRCAYPASQVQVLTGEEATRPAVLEALDRLAQAADQDTTAVVYFSGHGYRVSSTMGQAYYLMPFKYDRNRLFETAISGAEFAEKLRAIKARQLLVLLDCCHAAGMGQTSTPGVEMAKAPVPPEAWRVMTEGKGRVLIASSKEDEVSYAGRPYSAFTCALIEALCGQGVAKKDGYVRVTDLAGHTREKVPARTAGKQHPILHFEEADNFVVAYYAGGDIQPKSPPFVPPNLKSSLNRVYRQSSGSSLHDVLTGLEFACLVLTLFAIVGIRTSVGTGVALLCVRPFAWMAFVFGARQHVFSTARRWRNLVLGLVVHGVELHLSSDVSRNSPGREIADSSRDEATRVGTAEKRYGGPDWWLKSWAGQRVTPA